MKCSNCGSELEPNASFCFNCGAKVQSNNEVNKTEAEPVKVNPPIMPDAPEAPLPGTQPIPVVNPEIQAPVVNAVSDVPNVNVTPSVSNGGSDVNNNVNQVPTSSPKKKSKLSAIIIIIVLAVVAIVLLFILLKGTFKFSINGKEVYNSNSTPTTSSTTSSSTTTKPIVEQIINGVKIVIPEGWKYYPTNFEIVGAVMNSSLGTQLNIYPMSNVKYADYVNNQAAIQQSLTNGGVIVNSSLTIPENKGQFFGYNVTVNGAEELMYFTNMPDGSMMRFEVIKSDISVEEIFKLMTTIASSAKNEAE